MNVYVAEIRNIDTEEWDILDGLWFHTWTDAKEAVMEEMGPEIGAFQNSPWVDDPEWGGMSTEWVLDGATIPTRVRKLEPAWEKESDEDVPKWLKKQAE